MKASQKMNRAPVFSMISACVFGAKSGRRLLCAICLWLSAMQASAQVLIGDPAVCNGLWGSDITDSLTVGYVVTWVSGTIDNYNSFGISTWMA